MNSTVFVTFWRKIMIIEDFFYRKTGNFECLKAQVCPNTSYEYINEFFFNNYLDDGVGTCKYVYISVFIKTYQINYLKLFLSLSENLQIS